MANLNTKTISAGVGDILAVDGGLTGSAVNVKDGDGTASPLWLSTGYLGIGASTPQAHLHISNATGNTPNVIIENTSATDADEGGNILIRRKDSTSSDPVAFNTIIGDIAFQGYNYNGTEYDTSAIIRCRVDGTGGGSSSDMPGRLEFLTASDDTSGGTVRLTIRESGNVGIGASHTAPDQLLHLLGANAQLLISEDSDEFLRIGIGETESDAVIGWDDATDLHLGLYGSYTDATIDTKMVITSAGNVGVGTSTFDGSAVSYLAIANGTQPSAHTDNQVYIGAKDSAGTGTDTLSTLAIFAEEDVDATAMASDPSSTFTHRFPIWINGTAYWIALDPV